jgi:hypothetical protein
MNQEFWLLCTDSPGRMLFYLIPPLANEARAGVTDRKLRLFACACARLHSLAIPYPSDDEDIAKVEAWRGFIGAVEVWADGGPFPDCQNIGDNPRMTWLIDDAKDAARWLEGNNAGLDREQSDLLRCIFGNPFRPMVVEPAWRTWQGGTVLNLAQAAYEHRQLPSGLLDHARLAVLADALEEAGCGDADLLGHLRSGGDHVRGCRVLDALLGLA